MLSSICFMPASLTPQSLPPLTPTMSMYLSDSIGRDVHARRVVPEEERLAGLLGVVAIEEVNDVAGDFLVHRLRALQRERAFVLAHLVLGRAVGGLHPEDRARRGQAHAVLRINRARDFRDAGNGRHLHRRRDALLGRALVDVGEAHLLHGVQVVEVAPVLLEAVRRRQGIGVVAQVVLAELAGVVAEVQQELGQARRAGSQIGRAAGQLRRDHARAQRIHAGDERIAPGRAALHGDVVHEDARPRARCGRCWAFRRPSGRGDNMLGCIQPMSSPMMKRMLGFFACCPAGAGEASGSAACMRPAGAYQRSRGRKQRRAAMGLDFRFIVRISSFAVWFGLRDGDCLKPP